MKIEQMLFSQGFGTHHECAGLVLQGRVVFDGNAMNDPDGVINPEGKTFTVDGVEWPYFEKAIIVLNKPAGYECSTKPVAHPSVLSLLPAPLRKRGIQPVGRLDEDTTGLLLLTDDGALIHRWTHPKKHVEKIYRVTLKHEARTAFCQKLKEGVKLVDEEALIAAKDCKLENDKKLLLTITSGRYHQVKRMIAAAGNRVESLERVAFGRLQLPSTLKSGQWQWIRNASEVA